MPITENKFTGDELTAALTANSAELTPIIKGVLGNLKYVVRDEAEETTFKTNYESTVVGTKTKEFADKLEADVLALTGIKKKDANEKYYDYFKRATTEKLAAVTALQTELDALKLNHNPSAADKKRIEQLEAAVLEKETALTTHKTEAQKQIAQLKVGNELAAEVAKLRTRYKADIPAGVIEIVEKTAMQQLLAIAVVQDDGKVTYMGPDGKPIVDTANYQPKTADKLLEDALKDILDPGKVQPGAGSGAPGAGGAPAPGAGGNGKKTVVTVLPPDVKSKVQLTDYLLKMGYTQDEEDFNKVYSELGKALPLR